MQFSMAKIEIFFFGVQIYELQNYLIHILMDQKQWKKKSCHALKEEAQLSYKGWKSAYDPI